MARLRPRSCRSGLALPPPGRDALRSIHPSETPSTKPRTQADVEALKELKARQDAELEEFKARMDARLSDMRGRLAAAQAGRNEARQLVIATRAECNKARRAVCDADDKRAEAWNAALDTDVERAKAYQAFTAMRAERDEARAQLSEARAQQLQQPVGLAAERYAWAGLLINACLPSVCMRPTNVPVRLSNPQAFKQPCSA